MVPHAQDLYRLNEFDRRERMAATARAARIAEARGASTARPAAALALRRAAGEALVRIGLRLQGAHPGEPAGAAPARAGIL